MTTITNLMGTSSPPAQAQAIAGYASLAQTATGASLATALAMPSDFVQFTTVAASTGARLPASTAGNVNIPDSYVVVNYGANTLSVYPGTSSGKIANGSAGAAFSVAANKSAHFFYLGSDNWAAILSA